MKKIRTLVDVALEESVINSLEILSLSEIRVLFYMTYERARRGCLATPYLISCEYGMDKDDVIKSLESLKKKGVLCDFR